MCLVKFTRIINAPNYNGKIVTIIHTNALINKILEKKNLYL